MKPDHAKQARTMMRQQKLHKLQVSDVVDACDLLVK
jgi:hypothetical protein